MYSLLTGKDDGVEPGLGRGGCGTSSTVVHVTRSVEEVVAIGTSPAAGVALLLTVGTVTTGTFT